MEFIDPRHVVAEPGLAALMPESMARERGVLPQGREGGVLKVLIGDPDDSETMDMLRFVLGRCSGVRFALTSREAIREGIERIYGGTAP